MGKYDELTRGETEAFMNKIGGMEGLKSLLRDELVVVSRATLALRTTLWRTFEAVTYGSGFKAVTALEASGVRLDVIAGELIALPSIQETIEFSRVRVAELGFTKPTSIYTVLAMGEKLGYKLCRSSDALAIACGYADQPLGERVLLGNYPTKGSDAGRYLLFFGRNAGGRYIGMGCDGDLQPSEEIIFRK